MFAIIAATLLCGASLPGADSYLAGHEAEQAGRYGEAIKAYEACAEKPGPLAVYAQVKRVFCQAASGDCDGAIEAYRQLLGGSADGPWVRMAHACLASALATRKAYEEAAKEYMAALDFRPKPWWVQSYDRAAAEVFLECPALRGKGYDFFRNVVATTRLRAPRLEAAEQLAGSDAVTDVLVGAQGYIKTAEYQLALPLLLRTAPANQDWSSWLERLGSKQSPPGESDLACLAALPKDDEHTAWVREWLYYVARSQAAGDNLAAADAACACLVQRFPKADETGDAIWALAGRYSKAKEKEQAIAWYKRLDETNTEHTRADDALFAVTELQRGAKNVHAYAKACQHLSERHPESSLLAKAWYGAGDAYEKAGEAKAAAEAFAKAAEQGPGDFYAHRAQARRPQKNGRNVPVAGSMPFLHTTDISSEPLPTIEPVVMGSPRYRRIAFFAEHGFEEGEWEALALLPLLEKDPSAPALYAMLSNAGLAYTGMNIAEANRWGENNGRKSTVRLRILYPRAYWERVRKIAETDGVDPYLILAIARQESTFRPALTSFAGASGVMQLMPATARLLAKNESDFDAQTANNLEDPVCSLRLGTRYIKHMLESNDGNAAYALASYNAGPGNCNKWRKQFGKASLESFIESIPFNETRDYVKTVLANYAAYLSLYGSQ